MHPEEIKVIHSFTGKKAPSLKMLALRPSQRQSEFIESANKKMKNRVLLFTISKTNFVVNGQYSCDASW